MCEGGTAHDGSLRMNSERSSLRRVGGGGRPESPGLCGWLWGWRKPVVPGAGCSPKLQSVSVGVNPKELKRKGGHPWWTERLSHRLESPDAPPGLGRGSTALSRLMPDAVRQPPGGKSQQPLEGSPVGLGAWRRWAGRRSRSRLELREPGLCPLTAAGAPRPGEWPCWAVVPWRSP